MLTTNIILLTYSCQYIIRFLLLSSILLTYYPNSTTANYECSLLQFLVLASFQQPLAF